MELDSHRHRPYIIYKVCFSFTIIGLKTFNSKCPLLPPMVTATWLPITWAATMVMASHWVGFTLPAHTPSVSECVCAFVYA